MKEHIRSQPFQHSSLVVTLASILSLVAIQGSVSGYTGREIVIKLNNAQFAPLNGTQIYQVKVNVNYSVSDPTLIGQKINAVMKVYSSNGTLLKTTSFPTGFTANSNGTEQLLTKIPISAIQNITTVTTFTDANKTTALSNPVKTLPVISGLIRSAESTPTLTDNKTRS